MIKTRYACNGKEKRLKKGINNSNDDDNYNLKLLFLNHLSIFAARNENDLWRHALLKLRVSIKSVPNPPKLELQILILKNFSIKFLRR